MWPLPAAHFQCRPRGEWILRVAFPEFSADVTLVNLMFLLIQRTFANREIDSRGLNSFIELFSGCGALTQELLSRGWSGFDASNHDCLSGKGRRLYFNALGTLRKKGLCWLGTQCSSCVVLQRSAVNQCYGDATKRCLSEGDSMCSLSAVLFFHGMDHPMLPCH